MEGFISSNGKGNITLIDVDIYQHDRHYLKLINMKLREADRNELLASTGLTSQVYGLTQSIASSDIVCFTYMYKDKLIALSGAAYTEMEGFALVWAMGTNEVLEQWEDVEPLFIGHVNSILRVPGIKTIGNVIDLRNTAHIQWIKKLGFCLTGKITTLGGHNFETFYKQGSDTLLEC